MPIKLCYCDKTKPEAFPERRINPISIDTYTGNICMSFTIVLFGQDQIGKKKRGGRYKEWIRGLSVKIL